MRYVGRFILAVAHEKDLLVVRKNQKDFEYILEYVGNIIRNITVNKTNIRSSFLLILYFTLLKRFIINIY